MKGAIAAGHPLTVEVGAQVLADGGNAVDACIAAAVTSWVAESPLTGPGAGGFMLVHRARDGADILLDFFVAAPGRGLRRTDVTELEPVDVPFGSGETTQRFLIGPASCAVPGMLAGLVEAHRRFATRPWPELLAPAIELARAGVVLNRDQALLHEILDSMLRHDPDGRTAYGATGPLPAGARLVLDDLARTLEELAGDPLALYRGRLARELAAVVQDRGGRITVADLAEYRVIARRPVRAGYRGHEVVTNPPPSSGGVLIAYALRLLDRLGTGGRVGSAGAAARLADVFRESTRARGGDFVASLYRGGLARRLLADARIDADALAVLTGAVEPVEPEPAALPSTTHVSVVDAAGNAASLSSSTGCGSGVVVPGTGFQLNNMLGERDLIPHGRVPSPGRRLTSMMAPTILLRAGKPALVLGSAGSERLRGAIVQTVVNRIDHGLRLREAIDRPRVHLDGPDLHVEGGTDPAVADALERLGYRLVRWPGPARNLFFGGVSAVGPRANGALEAAGDPRRGGAGLVVR
jgi:gamma-glutamyltranspeptidase/glutathione hydrolase